MDLMAKIKGFSVTYNALLDLGRNKLPFDQGTNDERIALLVRKGYLSPGITRVHCLASEGTFAKTVYMAHYKRTPKGQRALGFAVVSREILNIPDKIVGGIYDFFHND